MTSSYRYRLRQYEVALLSSYSLGAFYPEVVPDLSMELPPQTLNSYLLSVRA
jgi:hypothetical protein